MLGSSILKEQHMTLQSMLPTASNPHSRLHWQKHWSQYSKVQRMIQRCLF